MATKQQLAARLSPDVRKVFLARCAEIEKRLTRACGDSHDPCLESGCSLEGEDEACLQPVLRAGAEYDEACERVFAELTQRAN
jgi:hypothetical protein